MGRLHLLEQEELLLRFRPHPLAYVTRYGGAFLWFLPAAVGTPVAVQVGSSGAGWGLLVAALVSLVLALVALRLLAIGFGFSLFAVLLFGGAGTLVLMVGLPATGLEDWYPVFVGGVVVLARLLSWEADRMARLHYLTTQRLIVNGGLRSRTERTISVEKIQEVRSARGVLGRLFDYGDLTLVFSKRLKKDGGAIEDAEVLKGIGGLSEVRHNVEQLLAEAKLPARDRRKRLEERRVKQGMRRLADWMRRERTRGRT